MSEVPIPVPPPPPPPNVHCIANNITSSKPPQAETQKSCTNNARKKTTFEPMKLIYAISSQDVEAVKRVISYGVDMNCPTFRETGLTWALSKELYEIAHVLINSGADPTVPEQAKWCRQPIHLATSLGRLDVVENLVRHGANVQACDAIDLTPLHYAASFGHQDITEFLLDRGAHVNVRDNTGRTPLFRAVEAHKTKLVCYLLDNGAEINCPDVNGWLPIVHSIVTADFDMIGELIDRGTDLTATDLKGNSLLHLAISRVDTPVLRTVIRMTPNYYSRINLIPTPDVHRVIALSHCSLDLVQLLVDYGVDIDKENYQHQSPFKLATSEDKINIMDFLLKAGVSLTGNHNKWIYGRFYTKEIVEQLDYAMRFRMPSLKWECKVTIRRSLRVRLSHSVEKLPLPGALKAFLHVSDNPLLIC